MMTINSDLTAPRKPLGLYIHIPFCIQKCNYCDFLSFGGMTGADHRKYIAALTREIEFYKIIYGNDYYVETIFIGGGTPSLLEESLICDLMLTVRRCFEIDKKAEISIESNPKTLTEEKLNSYLEAGINRLSIGLQSLDDGLLKYLGRVHSKQDFLQNYKLARASGFKNINIDLMFAVPGQTMKVWTDTLDEITALEPEHISFYSLQLEEGTPFFSMYREGTLKETEDELDRGMYHEAVNTLVKNGYRQYEISNAAKDGFQCRHNLKYWSLKDYLGLGLGAHSYISGTRFSNIAELSEYTRIGAQREGMDSDTEGTGFDTIKLSPFIIWKHENTQADNISEYLFTGMRKLQGISLDEFRLKFGVDLESIHGEVLKKHQQNGLVEMTGGFLRFTEKGIDISNMVLADFV